MATDKPLLSDKR